MIPVADNGANLLHGSTKVFAYIHTGSAPLYRAIMHVFMESKERFALRLRPLDVFDAIRKAALHGVSEQTEIEPALTQLCEWGNLKTHPDTGNAVAAEDFYNPRHMYQITSHGEAAEKAFALYDANSGRESQLHCSGLADIRFVLRELKQLSRQSEPDPGELHRTLLVLRALFEELVTTAQTFVDRLDRRADLPQPDARRLIDYSRRFIGELELEMEEICELIREIEAAGLERLLQMEAERNFYQSVDASQKSAAIDDCRSGLNWDRFRTWFISQPGLPSSSEKLSECVRVSLPALLRIVAGIHDQRIQRIDRSNDFRVLARWFAQAGSDSEAHVLWRAAFGLCSSRHLLINDATIGDREAQDIPASMSWMDAPPLRIPTDMRDYRGNSRTGGLSRIIDRSAERDKLAAASHEDAQRLLNAQRRFGTGDRIRLSELDHLETGEFEMFLELLGDAMSARVSSMEAVEILSGDGCLRVKLEPTGDDRVALIMTTEGTFSGPDQWIHIEKVSTDEGPGVVM